MFFEKLGQFVAGRPWTTILLWLVVGSAITVVAPRWDDVTNDGDLAYLPERMTSVRAEQLLARAFPEDRAKSQIALVVAREDQTLSADDLAYLDRLAAKFPVGAENPVPVLAAWTPNSDIVGSKLLSRDRKAAITVLTLGNEFMAVQNIEILDRVQRVLEEARQAADFPPGLELAVSGSAAIGGDMLASAVESIRHTELVTIAMVLLILAAVYRAPVLVLIPLVTIAASVLISTELVALLTQVRQHTGFEWFNFKVFKTTKIFVVTILFGSGTDFCLFLISRYREELARGLPTREALAHALGQVGHAVAASAMTTIIGLGMMVFADFGKFRNSGPAIGLCLLVALVACLTLAPALLRLFGTAVFWPYRVGRAAADASAAGEISAETTETRSGRFWNWIGDAILARPGLILVTSVLLMSTVIGAWWQKAHAAGGEFMQISYNLLAELDPQRPSVVGTRLIDRHFAHGELGPVTLVVYKPDGHFDQDEGKHDIARLTKLIHDMDGVAGVRSIAEPLGGMPGVSNPLNPAVRRKMAALRNPKTLATYLTQNPDLEGKVTRLDIVLEADPFTPQAEAYFGQIEKNLLALREEPAWRRAEFDFVGVTAGIRDLKSVTQSDQALIQILVTLAVLAILVVVLRRPLICLYLIVSVLFSYYVTLAATQLVFSELYPGFDGVDWKVPIFLFVILIAVGEDYNIFLATRVFEEQRRWGRLEGLRRAVVSTGGIITSCGVIMAGTFVSMMTGTLRGMLELGFALTLGVMLDTIVVRPILVPAFLAILWRRDRSQVQPAGLLRYPAESDPASLDDGPLVKSHAVLHASGKR